MNMTVSLPEIMTLPIMQETEVLSGKKVLHKKEVEWVSVIEMPVENFVRENEFVLSTGIGLGESHEDLLHFVKDVYESGASALAFATGRHLFDIPEEVRFYAEQKQFVLFEINWEVRFSDVIHCCMDKINDSKEEDLKQSEETQQQLLEVVLQGGNLSDVARFVNRHLNTPVMIVDQKGKVKGKSGIDKDMLENWTIQPTEKESDIGMDQHPLRSRIEEISIKGTTGWRMKIQSGNMEQGELIVFCSETGEDMDFSLLEHAVTASALAFVKENAVKETEIRLKDDFILSLANGEYGSKDRLVSRGKLLGYNLALPYVCIIGKVDNLEELYQKNSKGFSSYEHWFESMIYYVSEEILYAGETVERKVMTTAQENQLTIFLEMEYSVNLEPVQQFLDLVERRISMLFPGIMVTWGIGKSDDGFYAFNENYEKALTALDIGSKQKGPGSRIDYDETKINRLLQSLSKDKEVKDITMDTLAPLLSYDENRQMDLIGTFTAYHQNSGNVSQTARQLNLHRQSLLYRLRKIESLTQLSLMNPDDVFLLDLTIKIYSLGLRDT
ncbi:PucR family transcriptional regulator [Pontibacillus yanchengensis]|uniref:PucR family transcriptional regulator n=1 Tax=Pontibacillus yanchengensis TaxID=462910 RepID=A0ACC7VKJ5_9BACI|nr:PucR family transcriptional regulator [Pontibacillus yanchengensis]